MSDMHITPELLEAVKNGDLPSRVLSEICWKHLLSLCPACKEAYRVWESTGSMSADATLRMLPVLLARHGKELEEQYEKAQKDLKALLRMQPQARLSRIRRASRHFRGVMLASMLLDEAKKHMPMEPQAMYDLAVVAEEVLLRTPHSPGYYGTLARATAYKANAVRAQGRLRESEERLRGARNLTRQEDTVADTRLYAELDAIEGVLRKDQRRFEEAEALLTRSAALYRSLGEAIEAARVLVALAILHSNRQDTSRAIQLTETALALLATPEREPQLYLCCRHNLALFLTDQGQYETAAKILLADQDLYQRFSDLWTHLRHVWIQGRIAAGTGAMQDAEKAFLLVRDGFLRQANDYDAAMVSMDLAMLYLKAGRAEEVRKLAEEIHQVFDAEGVQRPRWPSALSERPSAKMT